MKIKQHHPLHNGRRTIALFSGSMASYFNAAFVFGAADFARQYGYNLVSFAGGPLNNPDVIAQGRVRIFEIADPALYDGLLLPLGTLTRFSNEAQVAEFLQPFRGKPMVIVGAESTDTISVAVDYDIGIRQLMTHLLVDHGYRRIAFISGPEAHLSSQAKLKTYREMLAQHGIAFNPDYVVHADLMGRSAVANLDTLFNERKLSVDCIMTVNDNQSFSIIDALQERGLRVPEDIAVTGAMDVLEASVSTPTLTTVREPMYDVGWEAARALAQALDGASWYSHILVPTALVVRQSCGCSAEQIEHRQHGRAQPADASAVQAADRYSPEAFATAAKKVVHAATQSLDAKIDEAELDVLALQLMDVNDVAQAEAQISYLEQRIEHFLREEVMGGWLALVPVVQRFMIGKLAEGGNEAALDELRRRFEALHARLALKAFNYRLMSAEKSINAFRELAIFLNASFDVDVIRRLVVRELNVTDCYVCLYDKKEVVRGNVRNILSIRNKHLINIDQPHLVYPSSQILPACIDARDEAYSLIVLPMSFRSEPIGFVALDVFDRKGVVYENLQALLAGALKNEIQIQELRDAEEKFSDIAFSTSDWLWEVDAQCRYTFCSEGVFHVLGYTAEEMIGRSLFEFVLASETHYLEQMQGYLIPNMLPLTNVEHINIHKNGHEVDLIISGKPIIKNGRLQGYRGAFKDTTEIKAQENRIKQLAYTDTLTGLPNRILFNDRLQMMMAAAVREPHLFAVLFLDLDRFKIVNDTLGHDAGDQLLQVVAQRLGSCVRDTDTLARLGGDEFTILISRIERPEDAVLVAQRIVNELNTPIEIRGHQLFVTTSVGIAIFPNDGDTAPVLLKNADKAMYKAKEMGKNRFVFYDAQMDEKSNRRMRLESILYKAAKEHSFEIHYQPQVQAKTGKIVGVEALLRLFNTELGTVSPAEFIGLTEEIGLIEEIGEWVFEKVCQQGRQWELSGMPLRVAVNVSARQLKNSSLAQNFIGIARQIGIAPHLIEIEITENAVIENEATAKALLQAFCAEGFKVAIDDFGTGYSSLSSLQKFPIDTVKIDRSFIHDSTAHGDSANIVRAIVHMARSLNLNTIAEGVETVEQLALLQGLGCQEIQGYFFSRPVPAEEIAAFNNNTLCNRA